VTGREKRGGEDSPGLVQDSGKEEVEKGCSLLHTEGKKKGKKGGGPFSHRREKERLSKV